MSPIQGPGKIALRIAGAIAIGSSAVSLLATMSMCVMQFVNPNLLPGGQRTSDQILPVVGILAGCSLLISGAVWPIDRRRGKTGVLLSALAIIAWLLTPVFADSRTNESTSSSKIARQR